MSSKLCEFILLPHIFLLLRISSELVPNLLAVVVVVASFGDDICRPIQAVVLETALITDKIVVSSER